MKKSEIKSKENKQTSKDKNVKNSSINYKSGTIIIGIVFLIFILLSCYCLNKSIVLNDSKTITYTEKSNLDYKVRLKDNNFYDTKVLDKNMSYIANLIEKIKVDFNYNFKSSLNINSDFSYDIVGVLKIVNPNTNDVYLTKEYVLLDNQHASITDNNTFDINKSINIDYDYYNKLANSFKSTYSIDTDSNLIVTLRIKRDMDDNVASNGDKDSNLSITIPLSQKAISIKMNYKDINNEEKLLSSKLVNVKDIFYLVIGIIILILAIVSLFLIRLFIKKSYVVKSKYEILVNKYLKEYDRLIVNVKTKPELRKFNVIKINSFDEMLDLHDNYNEPIRYFEVKEKFESYFYIQRENEIFLYVVSKTELE